MDDSAAHGMTRKVTLRRAELHYQYPPGYWLALVGVGVRVPAIIANGRVLAGYLVAAEELEDTITLTFEGLGFEDEEAV